MACADVDMDILAVAQEADPGERADPAPNIWRYRASEMMPEKRGPLHDLLQKQPAAFGSLQIVSGLVSVGLGIIFGVEQQMEYSLITLFRVSHMSGLLFVFAGLISVLLFKYPHLIQVCLVINCNCIVVVIIAICLICVDLVNGRLKFGEDTFLQLELLELCVLVFKAILSAVLCVFLLQEKRSKSA